ncbi:MAG: twin-arginine translocase TatA/TatE family subunit [Phycisphaerae bacterium]|nr:twin-arginine translocase TatA/TatE family subunit [Phycisphaerae bacterium]
MMQLTQNIMAWGSIGWAELLVVLVIALLIFGKRLPDVARSLGKSLTEFKKGMNETKDEIEDKTKPDEDKEVKK